MPELPEVHTTVEGLKKIIIGKAIKDVWSDFHIGAKHRNKQNIKNEKYFNKFRKIVRGAKIKSLERRGKNIIIHLSSNHSIIIHMKTTGHLMVGKYKKTTPPPTPSPKGRGLKKGKALFPKSLFPLGRGKGWGEIWQPAQKGPLQDSYNKFIHLVFSLSNGEHLALSDMRKFASVTLSKTNELHLHNTVGKLGIEPFDSKLDAKRFFEIIHQKKNWPIKSALLDQETIAGIGNIYSDEILWQVDIHPLSKADKIPKNKFGEILRVMRKILRFSIKHGGDSKSDYRNAFGQKGGFQNFHKVYGKKDERCPKLKCRGIIKRLVVRGRSAHFCPAHQHIYK